MKLLSILVLLSMTSFAEATIRYVNNTASCPGSGTTAAPYCNIQNAFDAAVAGDIIRIRDSGTAYTSGATTTANHDGTSVSPIIIEPDPGQNPNILAQIYLLNVNYWTVRNLTFNACSTANTPNQAIRIQADTRNITGNVVSGNTFNCWGGTNQSNGGNGKGGTGNEVAAVFINSGTFTNTATVTGNTISQGIQRGIHVVHGLNVIISNNKISGLRCGIEDGAPEMVGVGVSLGSVGTTIDHNTMHDFQDEASCRTALYNIGSTFGTAAYGAYCDAGDENSILDGNTIYNLILNNYAPTRSLARAAGFLWENRCNHATMKNNLIYNIDAASGSAIQLSGNDNCTSSNGNQVLNNTFYNTNGEGTVQIWNWAQNSVIRNNIVVATQVGSGNVMNVGSNTVNNCTGNVINNNLYYRVGGATANFQWGSNNYNFTNWKTQCNCDLNSLNADPLFAAAGSNFSLQPTSPAKDHGVTLANVTTDILGVMRPVGAAYDIGAYEFALAFPASPTGLTVTVK